MSPHGHILWADQTIEQLRDEEAYWAEQIDRQLALHCTFHAAFTFLPLIRGYIRRKENS